jgi:hypothetical protein
MSSESRSRRPPEVIHQDGLARDLLSNKTSALSPHRYLYPRSNYICDHLRHLWFLSPQADEPG